MAMRWEIGLGSLWAEMPTKLGQGIDLEHRALGGWWAKNQSCFFFLYLCAMMLLVNLAVNGGVVVVYGYGPWLPILSTTTIAHAAGSDMVGF
jgi:hypothetical protein